MRTEIVGRVENPEEQDREPLVVPVAAYTFDGEEVLEEFNFRPVMPAGAVMRAARAIQPNGVLSTGPLLDFLERSLMSEDRERFLEFLDRDDLMIEPELITQIWTTVTEAWSDRPTRLSSASSSGGSKTKRTSPGVARSAASASKRNRSS